MSTCFALLRFREKQLHEPGLEGGAGVVPRNHQNYRAQSGVGINVRGGML